MFIFDRQTDAPGVYRQIDIVPHLFKSKSAMDESRTVIGKNKIEIIDYLRLYI